MMLTMLYTMDAHKPGHWKPKHRGTQCRLTAEVDTMPSSCVCCNMNGQGRHGILEQSVANTECTAPHAGVFCGLRGQDRHAPVQRVAAREDGQVALEDAPARWRQA